jgi:hypothetical protein
MGQGGAPRESVRNRTNPSLDLYDIFPDRMGHFSVAFFSISLGDMGIRAILGWGIDRNGEWDHIGDVCQTELRKWKAVPFTKAPSPGRLGT